jgi:hypothetical protein
MIVARLPLAICTSEGIYLECALAVKGQRCKVGRWLTIYYKRGT